MSEILRPIRLDELGDIDEVERSIIKPHINTRPAGGNILADLEKLKRLLDDQT